MDTNEVNAFVSGMARTVRNATGTEVCLVLVIDKAGTVTHTITAGPAYQRAQLDRLSQGIRDVFAQLKTT